jgi:hypothetical protein
MPIAYILGNLLAEVGDAAGVVFLDEVGEAIEIASSDLSLDEMRTTGAITEIHFRLTPVRRTPPYRGRGDAPSRCAAERRVPGGALAEAALSLGCCATCS